MRFCGRKYIPVNIDLSNFASGETSTSRTSAGNLLPAVMQRTSPGTTSGAETSARVPSRTTKHRSGSMVVMEAIIFEEVQCCQALNAPWIKNTIIRTIASARFAVAGGSPKGFQQTKTRIPPSSRIDPKPSKKYPAMFFSRREGGDEGAFIPYSTTRR